MSKKTKKQKNKATKKTSVQQCHHYLNKLGIKSNECCIFNTVDIDSTRQKKFDKERKKYSFDSRETWSMDYTMATWLYEHFKVFRKFANEIVDLEYHQIDTHVLVKDKNGDFTAKPKTLNQLEAIDTVCKYLEYYFKNMEKAGLDAEAHAYQKLIGALHIIADLAPYMWW